jgi:hypothetical protein
MSFRSMRWLAVAAMVAALVSIGSPAFAQTYTGRIEVTVEDSTGGRLPGVTVELTGVQNQSVVTDARGEAKFLNLPVGKYQVRATLTGFNEWKSVEMTVAAGLNIPLAVKMNVAGAKEEVVVTAETPVLDNKKTTTATSVNLEELQGVPTARDPWVVMQSVPGIIMDRVNVGGSESGQQAGFMGKGSSSGDTTWNVDGMPITDMSSLSSPFYYDFDMFQEMSFTTGGADPKSATGGVQMNFMLKSGTNAFHGMGKVYFENESMQSTNLPQELFYLSAKDPVTGQPTGKGDRTQQFLDWGGELGGPILKDRWWFWVSYGKQDIRILKLSGTHDRTILPNISLKTQGQLTKALRTSFTFFQANKQKFGRDASSTRPQETTYNQDGPNQMFKFEGNYVVGNNLFLVGRYAHVKGGFTFVPQGGMDTDVYRDAGNVWHNSYFDYNTDRPQDAFVFDGNYFKGNHELKFGFTWRKTTVHSDSQISSASKNMIITLFDQGTSAQTTAWVYAPYATDGASKYYNMYIGDTISMKRATINLGLRYDYQTASVLPTTLPAVKGFEKYLPEIVAPGVSNALTYKLWQPRVGITYAVDQSRKTQLRATYAMFTSQIGTGAASFLSVAQYRYLYYDAAMAPGQTIAKIGDIIGGIDNFYAYSGFDPGNPANVAGSINKVGEYGVPRTHEFIIGVDREVMPNFGISASYTYRAIGNTNWRPTMKAAGGVITGADYVQLGTLTGTLPTGIPGTQGGTYSVPYFGITNTSLYPPDKGTLYQSRQGYSQKYKGFEVSATKRMANKWMARFGFSTNSWREYFDGLSAMTNPTHQVGSPSIDGGYVVSASGGSGKSGIYMVQPKYQFIANGTYQLPYQIDLGASYLIRQGYPMPWYQRTTKTGNQLSSTMSILLVPDFGQDRLPATQTLDFRVGKTLKMKQVTMNIDFDIFNIFNSATVLGRQYDKSSTSATTGYTQVLEIMQPRIARIGFRINF